MSALKKVVNLLWYRTPKDHKLANELAEEFRVLEAENARLQKGICKAEMAINKRIKRDVFEPMDKEDYDEWLDWLKEYGKEI